MQLDLNAGGLWVTHRITENNVCAPPSQRGQLKLIFVRQGEVAYTAEDKTYYPTRNSLIIVPPWRVHYLAARQGVPYDRYVIKFYEGWITGDIWRKAWNNVDVLDCDGNETICGLFRKFDDYLTRSKDENVSEQITELCKQILYAAAEAAGSAQAQISYMQHPLTARAVEYINDHIYQPISVEQLAQELNITRRYLHRLFEKHMCTTPQKYIIALKLKLAQKDLRIGRKATEVCASYGFADYPSFYRHYTRYFGHKPSDARKSRNTFDEYTDVISLEGKQ